MERKRNPGFERLGQSCNADGPGSIAALTEIARDLAGATPIGGKQAGANVAME
jgi:hypothetical protein